MIHEKLSPLDFAPRDDAPERVNLLIPTIDLEHFFGGYIGKLNLARQLAGRGMRVRIVTVDPVGPLPPSWRRTVESYSGLAGLFDSVEVAFGRESPQVEMSRGGPLRRHTWWTAHLARHALEGTERERFLYLIQEYEPFTFAMGSMAALAARVVRLPAPRAVLDRAAPRLVPRARPRRLRRGGPRRATPRSVAFQNAITDVRPPPCGRAGRAHDAQAALLRPAGGARGAQHVRAGRARAEPGGRDGRAARGMGAPRVGTDGAAAADAARRRPPWSSLPRRDQAGYADLLREHDVGLALMYTPHPSLPPIEMAAAGMLTVTNTFETKTADALAAISPNLIAVGAHAWRASWRRWQEAVAAVRTPSGACAGRDVRWSRELGRVVRRRS